MSLADEMKRGGEKERHHHPGEIIQPAIAKKHRMLGFMNDRIDRIHDDAENKRDRHDRQNMRRSAGDEKTREDCSQLQRDDGGVKTLRNGSLRIGTCPLHLNNKFIDREVPVQKLACTIYRLTSRPLKVC